MTTEVQTVEAPGDSAAVPSTCTNTRRLKRTGASTNEAADLKRPRTAPATPIDPSATGVNPSVGKLTASDTDSRVGGPTDNHLATRPSTTASAPAALNRALRSQPSVSTSPPSPAPGSCSASGAYAPALPSRLCGGAISGVVAAPQQQPLQQRQSADDHSSPGGLLPLGADPQQQQQQTQAAVPAGGGAGGAGTGAAVAAATSGGENSAPHGAAANGGGGMARSSSSHGAHPVPLTPHHHPQHHHSHSHSYSHGGGADATPQGLQLQQHLHHRHDALEEQVFSPAFHLPASASASAASSAQASPAGASPHQPPGAAKAPQGADAGGATPAAARGVVAALAAAAAVVTEAPLGAAAGGTLEARSSQPPGPGCKQLHAIDLNVVEGVAVDTDDDELAAAAPSGTAVAEDAAVAAAGARSGRRCCAVAAAAADRAAAAPAGGAVVEDGGGIEAVGEELSSSSAEGEEGKEEEEEEGVQEGGNGRGRCGAAASAVVAEEADLYECENDENAPMAARAGGPAAGRQRQPPPPQQQQQQQDAVLVASAPRGLAAAVSAALPSAAAAAAVVIVQQSEQQLTADEEDEDEDDEEGLMEFDPLLFIKQLPPLESCVPLNRPALLPRQTRAMARRKTLVLDLDETLVHSSLEAVDRSDFSFPVVFNGMEHQVYVRQRPHLLDFMVRVSALFEVVVFTASQRIYAERLLDILDPEQQLVRHRIYRDSCVVVDGNYLKDLSVLGRDLAHTVIVDNSPQAFGFQVDNGIPIESWYDDDSDTELLRLLPFLESLAAADVEDVRPRIRSQFRLRELIDRA